MVAGKCGTIVLALFLAASFVMTAQAEGDLAVQKDPEGIGMEVGVENSGFFNGTAEGHFADTDAGEWDDAWAKSSVWDGLGEEDLLKDAPVETEIEEDSLEKVEPIVEALPQDRESLGAAVQEAEHRLDPRPTRSEEETQSQKADDQEDEISQSTEEPAETQQDEPGHAANESQTQTDPLLLSSLETLCGGPMQVCSVTGDPLDKDALPLPSVPSLPLPSSNPAPSPGTMEPPASMAMTTPQQVAAVEEGAQSKGGLVAAAVAAAAVVALAAGSASSSLLAGFAKWLTGAKGTVVALYARLRKDKVLDHGTRRDLYLFLEANPGACIAQIQEALGTSLSTTRHHLQTLKSNGLVVDVRNGRKRCFFTTSDGMSPKARTAVAALSSSSANRVFQVIRDRPGISQQQLAEALSVSRTSVIFHVRRLQDAGMVRKKQRGRQAVYLPTESTTGAPATPAREGVPAPA
jgi:predicted transcriptional regulator